jgi:uncharacterized protein (TIGR02266 family)
MASTISEGVLSTCDPAARTPERESIFTPPAAASRPRRSLTSVLELDEQIAARQQVLTKLQAEREREQTALRNAHTQISFLKSQARDLELSVAEKNQTAFLLINELDRMQTVYAKVVERARRIVQRQAPPSQASDDIGDRRAQETAPAWEAVPAVDTSTEARPDERRVHARTPVVAEVGMCSENNFYVGFTQDISKGGLFIATPDTLSIGTRFLMHCTLPDSPKAIRCMVEVAWLREYHQGLKYELGDVPGMGVKFIGLTDEDASAIAAFQKSRESLFFPDDVDLC